MATAAARPATSAAVSGAPRAAVLHSTSAVGAPRPALTDRISAASERASRPAAPAVPSSTAVPVASTPQGLTSDIPVREQLFGTDAVFQSSSQRVRPIAGRKPINAEYAGQVYTFDKLPQSIKEKYPNLQRDYQHGIPFTGTGHPDFSRYATKRVQIEVTGIRWKDEALANKAAGLVQKPAGYTWHHHHDGQTMMLVPSDLHDAIKHSGGVAILKSGVF